MVIWTENFILLIVKEVYLSKGKGNLGIRNLYALNRILFGKWNWRFAKEEGSTWRRIIYLKYEVEPGDWFSKWSKVSHAVGIWKEIRKEAS